MGRRPVSNTDGWVSVLGFDTGTSFGYAHLRFNSATNQIIHGTSGLWDLNAWSRTNRGARLDRCQVNLQGLFAAVKPAVASYENVARHRGTKAAHSYGALEGLVQIEAYRAECKLTKYFPQTLKKAATGYGSATKQQVIEAIEEQFPGVKIKSDDHSDAIACALAAIEARAWVAGGC